jgi:hypothetical protein
MLSPSTSPALPWASDLEPVRRRLTTKKFDFIGIATMIAWARNPRKFYGGSTTPSQTIGCSAVDV